uniref:SEC63 domain-containing protein n=1 Tax=Haptolina brevifila TaxID=156173 RepID=A0A7S2H1A8_9EUKA|mmetsp:Transcript_50048/g.99704  ORF Transcript_50048/g.99704 Transcript_50048/m.99704 type:complete len:363 (+) Transcript_50048:62-1150(+)|eukprot:CAMPEP_0174702026 /NCGR_PEP_ID=MMETSP1094-20130205/6461_1 /TAXON_ID=156173 /ORGANISM="Chrysochromulina brevifilum, Strain UTEX LB 985" /LENGTH=362 /DNA_ID=CAMNT_0015899749 /DNA_START=59 /DNA_END=1147 /DNA_ORIENTATION=-
MNPAAMQAAANMTPEQAQEMLDQMSPEEREKARQMQETMRKAGLDLAHLVQTLKPSDEDPDAEVSLVNLCRAFATAPAMQALGTDEKQLLGPTLEYSVAKDALSKVEDKLEELGALKTDELNDMENETHWRNVVLTLWHMWKLAADDAFVETLPGELDYWRQGANQTVTQLLIKCQMLMPQQRWVQVTLAIASMSALMANALWSHTDPKALTKMAEVISNDGLLQPKLCCTASAVWKESPSSNEVPAGQQVLVNVELVREHASEEGSEQPKCNNPQDIYEAYWLYVEGIKPQGTANSLIVAKPMVVKDVTQKVVTGTAIFLAPPDPAVYKLRIYITSTSVIGIHLKAECQFVVVEDDVPDLE